MALIDSLVSYWKLDEASGNALDAHGSNDLTDNNTVGSATGKIGNARDFVAANSEKFSHVDNADFSPGDTDFSFSCWINADVVESVGVFGKVNGDFTTSYSLGLDFEGKPLFQVQDAAFNTGTATWGSALSTGTWYHVVCWHDATNNEVGITVNDGTPVTQSYSNGSVDGDGDFVIGDYFGFMDGRIDEFGYWGKVLSSAEITELYNSGAGLAYPFTGGEAAGSADWVTRLRKLTMADLSMRL